MTDIAVSPDNTLLASASWDHSIRIWQLQNDAIPLHVYFHQHTNKIWRIAFHPLYRPGHRLLFSACMDGTTQIFDLDNYNSRTVTLYANPAHLSLPNSLTAFTEEEASQRGYHSLLLPTLTSPDRQQPTPAEAAQQRPQQPQPHQPTNMQPMEAGSSDGAASRSEAGWSQCDCLSVPRDANVLLIIRTAASSHLAAMTAAFECIACQTNSWWHC